MGRKSYVSPCAGETNCEVNTGSIHINMRSFSRIVRFSVNGVAAGSVTRQARSAVVSSPKTSRGTNTTRPMRYIGGKL